MDWLEQIAKNFVIPFYNKRHGIDAGEQIKSVMKSQFFSPDKIKELQWNSLKNILNHAYSGNKFYKQQFDKAGINPNDIKSFEDFSKIPPLTKDDIRNNGNLLISDGYQKENMVHKRTGGSTGVPVHLYVDRDAFNFKYALTYRHNSWAQYYQESKKAALWGDTDKKYGLKERIYKFLYERTIFLDTLKMDDAYLFDFVNRLRIHKPKNLMGHGHSLYFFAKFLKNNKITDIHFDGIISTAETLFNNERKVVEDVFGKIVYDRYGCEELSIIASECEQGDGLHIAAEGLYVEIENGGIDEPGELIITDLVNKGMPFIRYRIGDLATACEGLCHCGRGLPRLGRIAGRTTDILYTPEGKKISGVSILDTFVIHIDGFKQVQIIQNEIDRVIFRIIKDDKFSDRSLSRLKETVFQVFGPKMKYNIEFVNEIQKTSRGKFQFTICNINPDEL